MNSVRVVLSPEAAEAYRNLENGALKSGEEKAILDSLHKKVDLLMGNLHLGQPIPKKLIPYEYKARYGIKNLFSSHLSE